MGLREVVIDSSLDYFSLGRCLYYLRYGYVKLNTLDKALWTKTEFMSAYIQKFIQDKLRELLDPSKTNFVQLLRGLTASNSKDRFINRFNGDISKLKKHSFFNEVDWDLISKRNNLIPKRILRYLKNTDQVNVDVPENPILLGNVVGWLNPSTTSTSPHKLSNTKFQTSSTRLSNSIM